MAFTIHDTPPDEERPIMAYLTAGGSLYLLDNNDEASVIYGDNDSSRDYAIVAGAFDFDPTTPGVRRVWRKGDSITLTLVL